MNYVCAVYVRCVCAHVKPTICGRQWCELTAQYFFFQQFCITILPFSWYVSMNNKQAKTYNFGCSVLGLNCGWPYHIYGASRVLVQLNFIVQNRARNDGEREKKMLEMHSIYYAQLRHSVLRFSGRYMSQVTCESVSPFSRSVYFVWPHFTVLTPFMV